MEGADFGWDSTTEPRVYPGGLVCYRYWRIAPLGHLRAVAHPISWSQGQNEAVCQTAYSRKDHLAPQSSPCRCGFYGWYTVEEARENHGNPLIGLGTFGPHGNSLPLVLGAVYLSGRFIPGGLGVRAQYATPLGVVFTRKIQAEHSESVSRFLNIYPKIKAFATVEEMIGEFPPEDVAWAKKKDVLWRGSPETILTTAAANEIWKAARETPCQFVMSFGDYHEIVRSPGAYPVVGLSPGIPDLLYGIPVTYKASVEEIRLERTINAQSAS